eukprot:tig00000806_g4377.t1
MPAEPPGGAGLRSAGPAGADVVFSASPPGGGGVPAAESRPHTSTEDEEKRPLSPAPHKQGDPLAPQPQAPWTVLAGLLSPVAGGSIGFALQTAYATKTLLELGLPERWVAWVWLVGPISGLFLQPAFGSLSDSCRLPWGKRRPFILGFTVSLLLAMALFCSAEGAGARAGISPLVLLLPAFWLQDISLNLLQGPCRAVLVDVLSKEQQATSSAGFAFVSGLGNIVGALLGSLRLGQALPALGGDLRALYVVSMACIAALVLPALFCGREPKPEEEGAGPGSSRQYGPLRVLRRLSSLPRRVFAVCGVQVCSWFAMLTFSMFAADWMGRNVYPGDPSLPAGSPGREAYDEGIRRASFAYIFMSVASMGTALALPALQRRLSVRALYLSAHLLFAALLGSAPAVSAWAGRARDLRDPGAAPALPVLVAASSILAGSGVAFSFIMALPWTVLGHAMHEERSNRSFRAASRRSLQLQLQYPPAASPGGYDEEEDEEEQTGLAGGLLNVSLCAGNILAAVAGYALVGARPGDSGANLAAGGAACLAGALLIALSPSM